LKCRSDGGFHIGRFNGRCSSQWIGTGESENEQSEKRGKDSEVFLHFDLMVGSLNKTKTLNKSEGSEFNVFVLDVSS
jgi:hypothetical protein